MSKITEKQLIFQLKELKQIKPKQEWVSLLKSQILASARHNAEALGGEKATFANIFSSVFQKKLVYSLATLAIMIFGVFGFVKYETDVSVQQLAIKSQASLIGQANLKQDIASLKVKINNLKAKVNDPVALKEIAVSLKTLASVSETDLTAGKGVKDLYETIVANQISDLKKATLTKPQEKILIIAEDLYKQEK